LFGNGCQVFGQEFALGIVLSKLREVAVLFAQDGGQRAAISSLWNAGNRSATTVAETPHAIEQLPRYAATGGNPASHADGS